MKRFFKPVGDAPAAKRAKGDEGAGGGSGGLREGGGRAPRRLATWNANGLGARARSAADCAALEAFVRDFEPDVLAVQEVWMRRDGSAAGRLARYAPPALSSPLPTPREGALSRNAPQ